MNYKDTLPPTVISGKNPVREFLASYQNPENMSGESGAGTVSPDALYVLAGCGGLSDIIQLARTSSIPFHEVPKEKMKRFADSDTERVPQVVLTTSSVAYAELESLLNAESRTGKLKHSLVIVCDGITDPHNLGAIIRTAECAGADAVMFPNRRSAAADATVWKTSAGAAAHIPLVRVTNTADALRKLKKNGYFVYGASAGGDSTDYAAADYSGSGVCLVIGSEGSGIHPSVLKECDYTVGIPQNGKVSSLNASVAAGILMYEIVKQLRL